MIVAFSCAPKPDLAFIDHVAELAETYREKVRFFQCYKEALDAVCNGRVQGKPKGPVHEPVTQVIIHNFLPPEGSGEPSPMTAARDFGGWSMRGRERVLEVSIFPELQFPRVNRDSDGPRWKHTAVRLT